MSIYQSIFKTKLQNYLTRCYYNMPKSVNTLDKVFNVDLRSDTFTNPSEEMKRAMVSAPLGDDVYEEDPTVKEFESRMAILTKKENALFVPTGTMGNLISVMVHCNRRGSEVLLGDKSHIFLYEQGGMAQFGGIQAHNVPTSDMGTFDLDDLQKRIRYDDIHCPTTDLICIENTHNYCGGKVLPLDYIQKIGELAKRNALPLHMDGARIMNASVASKVPVWKILEPCDSASICFSKGLGTPVGSVIVGSKKFIQRCRRLRKGLGGGMRQSGILAAAGLFALDNMIDRLEEDHINARKIAQCIEETESSAFSTKLSEVQSNIVMINVNPDIITTEDFCKRLAMITEEEKQYLEPTVVKMLPWSEDQIRFVTHFNINSELVEHTCSKLKFVLNEIGKKC